MPNRPTHSRFAFRRRQRARSKCRASNSARRNCFEGRELVKTWDVVDPLSPVEPDDSIILAMIPVVARRLRKYLAGTCGSRIKDSDEKHATSPLGHSKPARIQDPPFNSHRPDVGQRVKAPPHSNAVVGVEEPDDVLSNSDSWVYTICVVPHFFNDSNNLKEQTRPFSTKTSALTSHAEVLAWEPECDHVNRGNLIAAHRSDIVVKIGMRPPMS